MAKTLTFSKKGRPMGPNRNPKEGEKRQWTREEDDYLRIAIKDGISLETVCARLGRTHYSVACRKSKIGIEGRFSRTTKTRKTQGSSVKQSSSTMKKQPELFDQVQVMVLETGVELPSQETKSTAKRCAASSKG